jgi:hypothetical protein
MIPDIHSRKKYREPVDPYAMNRRRNRMEIDSLFAGDWFRIPFDSVIGLWIEIAVEKRDLRRGIFENHFGGANRG